MSYISSVNTQLFVDTTSTSKYVLLPPAKNYPGDMIYIKDYAGTAFYSSIYITTSAPNDTLEWQQSPSSMYGIMSTNYQSLLLASDGISNWMILQSKTFNNVSRIGGPVAYLYTGFTQTFLVPNSVTNIYVEIWAAGGGADYNAGGAGAYVSGYLAVTPQASLTVIVGKGGASSGASETESRGGGGGGAGCGGGFSAIRYGPSNYLVIVGAGGGGGGATYYTGPGGYGTYSGNGADGTTAYSWSRGGTQTSGGSPNGAYLFGGGGNSGGGGGGFYGGGGGPGSSASGAGGSSFTSNVQNLVGSNAVYPNYSPPPASNSPHYITGIAAGASTQYTAGGHGLVWITPV